MNPSWLLLIYIIFALIPSADYAPIPSDARILFTSDRDTIGSGLGGNEIYAKADNGTVTRITYSRVPTYNMIFGLDPVKQNLLICKAILDTKKKDIDGDGKFDYYVDFDDRRALYILDLNTRKEKRITRLAHHAEGKNFSPDGQWITFFMKLSDDETLDIYKMRTDGTRLQNLTSTPNINEGDPNWSPDGTKIVYSRYVLPLHPDDENKAEIWMMNALDGSDKERLTDGGVGQGVPGVWEPGDYDPALSPDGRWIVFERQMYYDPVNPQNFGSGIWHIWKFNIYTRTLIDLSELGGYDNAAEYLPSFSPDGKSIILGAVYEDKDPNLSFVDIFERDAETGVVKKRWTDHPQSDLSPRWVQ